MIGSKRKWDVLIRACDVLHGLPLDLCGGMQGGQFLRDPSKGDLETNRKDDLEMNCKDDLEINFQKQFNANSRTELSRAKCMYKYVLTQQTMIYIYLYIYIFIYIFIFIYIYMYTYVYIYIYIS